MTFVGVAPLCHYCHNFCHPGRMRALLDAGELTHAKYAAVIQHGEAVLKNARLKKSNSVPKTWAKPEDWRLVIDGVEYAKKDYPCLSITKRRTVVGPEEYAG